MKAIALDTAFGHAPVALGFPWVSDVRVVPLLRVLEAERDYSFDAESGGLIFLEGARAKAGDTLAIAYVDPSDGPTTRTISHQSLIQLVPDATGITVTRMVDWVYSGETDYSVDERSGELYRLPDGRITETDTVRITAHCFGFDDDNGGVSYDGLPASPDDFELYVGTSEMARLSQAGETEGRSAETLKPHYGRIALALENAAALLTSRVSGALKWKQITEQEPNSAKGMVMAVARHQLDPLQGKEIKEASDQALKLIPLTASALPSPSPGGGEEMDATSSVAWSATSPLITAAEVAGW